VSHHDADSGRCFPLPPIQARARCISSPSASLICLFPPHHPPPVSRSLILLTVTESFDTVSEMSHSRTSRTHRCLSVYGVKCLIAARAGVSVYVWCVCARATDRETERGWERAWAETFCIGPHWSSCLGRNLLHWSSCHWSSSLGQALHWSSSLGRNLLHWSSCRRRGNLLHWSSWAETFCMGPLAADEDEHLESSHLAHESVALPHVFCWCAHARLYVRDVQHVCVI
jgi:hypothetical protein